MTYKYYPITGIPAGRGPNGEVPLRQEIDDWSQKPENATQVILFLLALRRFQDIPPDRRESFFQIAGIHGMPYKSWDEPDTTSAEVDKKGYCTHANYLFPPWHRPYLLLFEQRLYEIMIHELIPEYPQSMHASLRAAADSWRLPYWDWATNPRIPALASRPKVVVSMPGKVIKRVLMDNPLYQFKMPNNKNMASEGVGDVKLQGEETVLSYGNCIGTSRCPEEAQTKADSRSWIEGVVNNDKVAEFMTAHSAIDDKDYGTAAEMVYRLLTYPLEYPDFATVALHNDDPQVQTDVNIEFIHNNIHYWAGGEGGHMSQIPVASFDPIFWVHHCNIDRLWAIWQELNPDKWFIDGTQRPFDDKTIGLSDIVTNKTPLRPFHKDEQGTTWLPDEVRNFKKLGYSYPELQPWLPEYQVDGTFSRDRYVTSIMETVNLKYGVCRQQALHILGQADTGELPGGMEAVVGGVAANDFAISVRYSKFAFGGHPFNIEIFLEPADGSGCDYRRDYVTNVYNFSRPAVVNGEEVCTNCSNLEGLDVRVSSYVPITPILNRLMQQGRLASLKKGDVEDLLKRLYWRVTMAGQPVPEENWRRKLNLQIIVSMSNVTHYHDPTMVSGFKDFDIVPSLGVAAIPSIGVNPLDDEDVEAQYLAWDKIIKLHREVGIGGSIVVESSSLDLTVPNGVDYTKISFMYFDESSGADPHDEENYDVLLSLSIRRRNRIIRLSHKPANGGWQRQEEVPLDHWLQRPNPLIRVDVRGSDYEIFIDGKPFRTRYKALGNKNITHVQYWSYPDSLPPALSRALAVMTYQSTNDLPAV